MVFNVSMIMRKVDMFGHPIGINYKGSEVYNTALGGAISILVYILTLSLTITAISELVSMREPTLTDYTKPMTKEDRQQLFPIRGSDYDFIFAVEVVVRDNSGHETSDPYIPPEVGFLSVGTNDDSDSDYELKNCKDVIPQDTYDNSTPDHQRMIDQGRLLCLEPDRMETSYFQDMVEGNTRRSTIKFNRCQSACLTDN